MSVLVHVYRCMLAQVCINVYGLVVLLRPVQLKGQWRGETVGDEKKTDREIQKAEVQKPSS